MEHEPSEPAGRTAGPPPEGSGPVELLRTRRARRAREYLLVLQAAGVESALIEEHGELRLVVPEEDLERAGAELEAYERENVGWPRVEELPEVLTGGALGVAAYWALIFGIYVCENGNVFTDRWHERGRALAAAIRDGEWWRALTALTLHADLAHLAGNLVFGALFFGLLFQVTGTGVGTWAVLVAGGLGNYLNAWIHPPGHASIGASTALFGALGILAGHRAWQRRLFERRTLTVLVPLLAGLFLLAQHGTGGERTDVTGHACGFGVGLALGVALAVVRLPGERRVQWIFGLAAAAGVALAWTIALS
jgi:rhomboid protease GluP